jgi:multidrug efflux pump subunit AcrA (membrane-fusion protein)
MLPIERNKLSSYQEIEAGFREAGFDARSVGESHTPKILEFIFRYGLIFLIIFIVALLFVPWQQVSIGNGTVISYSTANRGQKIAAPITGRIDKWLVQEGQKVLKGTELVKLSDFDEQFLTRLSQQLKAALLGLKAADGALAVGQSNLDRQKRLFQKGLTSEREVELAQIEVAKFEATVSSAQSNVAELEVKIARQKSQLVKAPFDGIVVRILAPDGGTVVDTGDPLALMVPETEDRAVEITIKGIDLPLISKGRKVRLQFEGWPAVQFTGWPSVAVGTFGGTVEFVDAIDDGKGNYRVLVFPDLNEPPWPEQRYLRQGVRVVGWILLDEVTLGWELWRKLNSFPMTVSDPKLEETSL